MRFSSVEALFEAAPATQFAEQFEPARDWRTGQIDQRRTLSRLRGLPSDLIDPAFTAHQGRIVKRTGGGEADPDRAQKPHSLTRSPF